MSTRTTTGGPLTRESGIGNVNPAMIRERAAEIATSDGRSEDEIRQQDYDQARDELHAELRPPSPEEVSERTETSTNPTEPAASTGQARTTAEASDEIEQNHAARLVEEGIEEAVHDERVESGKRTLREGEQPEEEI